MTAYTSSKIRLTDEIIIRNIFEITYAYDCELFELSSTLYYIAKARQEWHN